MRELLPGPRILLGPGPSMADPRVLRAMSTALLGQFDPEFTAIMNDVMELTRFAFEAGNERAFPVSGTGRAALEAAITSIVEPGDRVIVGECGRFGLLLIEIAERCGAAVSAVRGAWGSVLDPDPIAAELRRAPTKLVAILHGETSTGVLQPLEAIARVTHEHGALLMADCVVTLGGCEVAVDRWGVDVARAWTRSVSPSSARSRRSAGSRSSRRSWCPKAWTNCACAGGSSRTSGSRSGPPSANYRVGSGGSAPWAIRRRGAMCFSASPRSSTCCGARASELTRAPVWMRPVPTIAPPASDALCSFRSCRRAQQRGARGSRHGRSRRACQ